MAIKALHTPEAIRKLFRHDVETGNLFWNTRPVEDFAEGGHTSQHTAKIWNARFAGKEAFTSRNEFGYAVTNIGGRIYRAHRTIWAMVHGEWPAGDIDHINGVPDDNRLENLRSVTHKQNLRNQKQRSTNTSGFMGVSWCKNTNKWRGHITLAGKYKSLGYFDSKDDAIAARAVADKAHGYHANHGRVDQ